MPAQQITLSEQQADFVRQSVDQGDFPDVNAVIEAGLAALRREQATDYEADDAEMAETLPVLRKSLAEADAGLGRSIHEVMRDFSARRGVEFES